MRVPSLLASVLRAASPAFLTCCSKVVAAEGRILQSNLVCAAVFFTLDSLVKAAVQQDNWSEATKTTLQH